MFNWNDINNHSCTISSNFCNETGYYFVSWFLPFHSYIPQILHNKYPTITSSKTPLCALIADFPEPDILPLPHNFWGSAYGSILPHWWRFIFPGIRWCHCHRRFGLLSSVTASHIIIYLSHRWRDVVLSAPSLASDSLPSTHARSVGPPLAWTPC